jgi:hypothetical protein
VKFELLADLDDAPAETTVLFDGYEPSGREFEKARQRFRRRRRPEGVKIAPRRSESSEEGEARRQAEGPSLRARQLKRVYSNGMDSFSTVCWKYTSPAWHIAMPFKGEEESIPLE